jgi:hypothetical protein
MKLEKFESRRYHLAVVQIQEYHSHQVQVKNQMVYELIIKYVELGRLLDLIGVSEYFHLMTLHE